ncbi:MAG: hypothetical protein K8R69_07175, partial [Deltaproteobacteria bacterium]|nr:hypothetical protein [Deltaproteobacteria bacterium]
MKTLYQSIKVLAVLFICGVARQGMATATNVDLKERLLACAAMYHGIENSDFVDFNKMSDQFGSA